MDFDEPMDRDALLWVADVAGISVGVHAADDRYAATARGRLGASSTAAAPALQLRLGPEVPWPPEALEVVNVEGYQGWSDGDRLWMGDDEMVVRVEADQVVVGGPIQNGHQEDRFDDLVQFGIAAAVARPDQMMLHAAVVSRGDAAMLLVGRSGAGKSTLAGAALVGGWDLLGDDLCVYRPDDGTIEAVFRTPYVPREIADRYGLLGTPEGGDRGRVQLPVDLLATGRRRLVGIVSVSHGSDGAVAVGSAGDLSVFDDALPGPPFPYVLRRYLRAVGTFLDIPAVQLEHAVDIDRRVPRAIELLDEAWAQFGQ